MQCRVVFLWDVFVCEAGVEVHFRAVELLMLQIVP